MNNEVKAMQSKFLKVAADERAVAEMLIELKRIESRLDFVASGLGPGSITHRVIAEMLDIRQKVQAVREGIEAENERDSPLNRAGGGVVLNFRS